MYEKCLKEG